MDEEKKTKNYKVLPKKLREQVWNTYIGSNIGKSSCLCCKTSEITQMNFHYGHIISSYNNGSDDLTNLLPICSLCNSSMGTMNMDEFMKKYNIGNLEKKGNNISINYNIIVNNIDTKNIEVKNGNNNYECIVCKYETNILSHFKKHENSKKHKICSDLFQQLKLKNNKTDIKENKDEPVKDAKDEPVINIDLGDNKNKPVKDVKVEPVKENKDEPVINVKIDDIKDELTCSKCDFSFSTKSNKYRHERKCNFVKSNNDEYIKSNICPKCNIKYDTRKQQYIRHILYCKGVQDQKKEDTIETIEDKIKLIKLEYEKKLSDQKIKNYEDIMSKLIKHNR
jgi:hypothetical protein